MRLLITVLMMSAPLVLSAPATKRAPGDESRENDLCSHPLDSTLCETSEHNSPVVWRKTGFELAAASALNDMRVISYNRFNEARTPSTITSTPRSTTTTTTTATRKPGAIPSSAAYLHLPPVTNTLASQITSDTPTPVTQATAFYKYRSRITSETSTTPMATFLPPSPPETSRHLPPVTNNLASPTTSHTPTHTSPSPASTLQLPSVTNTFASPTTSYTPRTTSPSPASSLQLPSGTNTFASPTTSHTPRTTTPVYYRQLYSISKNLTLPKSIAQNLNLQKLALELLGGLLAHVPSVTNTFASPTTSHTPRTTSPSPASSLQLPSVTNTFASPTTSHTPRTTSPSPASSLQFMLKTNAHTMCTNTTPVYCFAFHANAEFLRLPKPEFKSLPGPAHLPSVIETFASPTTSHGLRNFKYGYRYHTPYTSRRITTTDPPPTTTDLPPTITEPAPTTTDPPPAITEPPPTTINPPPTITDPPSTMTETPKRKRYDIRKSKNGSPSHGFHRFRNVYRHHTPYTSRRITTTDPPPTTTGLPPTITEPAPTTTDPPPTTTGLPPTITEPTLYIPSSSNTRSPFVPFVWGQKRTTMPGTSTQTPEYFPDTPSITPTDPSTTTSDTPTTIPHDPGYVRCVFGISSTGECEPPPGTRLAPFLRADPLPPQLAALHLSLVTKDTPRPTTSDTPTITTQDPTDPCLSSLSQCTTPEPSFVEVPLFRDSSLPLASVTNDTPKPTTSDKPTPTMQTTVFYTPEPVTKATILPAATSLHLPLVTNNLVSPTTPTSTRLYPPQPQPTRPATNRSPFHDACSTISTDEDNNPSRAGSVLCVLNIANYYDQVHYHQTIHNHYNV